MGGRCLGFVGFFIEAEVVIEHHDFLPDFACEAICELFDVVNSLENNAVAGALSVEGSEFTDE
jgi:hypothetical protein